jgi:hypothetical protein
MITKILEQMNEYNRKKDKIEKTVKLISNIFTENEDICVICGFEKEDHEEDHTFLKSIHFEEFEGEAVLLTLYDDKDRVDELIFNKAGLMIKNIMGMEFEYEVLEDTSFKNKLKILANFQQIFNDIYEMFTNMVLDLDEYDTNIADVEEMIKMFSMIISF